MTIQPFQIPAGTITKSDAITFDTEKESQMAENTLANLAPGQVFQLPDGTVYQLSNGEVFFWIRFGKLLLIFIIMLF